MTAAINLALAAEFAAEADRINGITEQQRLTGLTFDHMAPLPPLKEFPRGKLWEPAAVRFRDLPGGDAA